ncbi:hypothetical protein GR160_03805 [Flavobacterium sp. Sd200]|uniref:DUF6095 family protein n=1 Tax=Flavobacterium sp. Sd200 TaxID=2692211 RepID=UPI00136DF89C|nr:DUF6095 family protein [Flavobacterium sp. Sd200]MXN90340.1 hypothetical protein [Flavobacterium sp. Sd200]
MPTNKVLLRKGITYLSIALPLLFIGPVIIHSSFKNQEHPFFIPVLGGGIIFCIAAIAYIFVGLRTIMRSLFNE